MKLERVFLVDAVRTPIGKYGGGLRHVRADDLAAHVLRALCARHPPLCERVEQVIFGATNQAGEDNRNVARMAALLAGLPFEVPAVSVNRLCGSGLEAVDEAARRIATGDADIVIAGGVENMTRAPFVMGKTTEAFSRSAPKLQDTTLGYRFENARMAERFPLLSMGETAEEVATKWGIGREEQDQFALESQRKAVAAQEAGAFRDEVVPVPLPAVKGEPAELARDESPRAGVTLEGLAKLPPVFRKSGSVTAGNSSPLNDGAACVLLASERGCKALGKDPVLSWVSSASAGVHPSFMGEGPIPATQKALSRAGWKSSELDAIELNEAFAAQALACIRGLALDPSKVNVRGGAIALGHPIGCSGARIVGTLLHTVRSTPNMHKTLATLCIGMGQGLAVCFERA